jgi:hypothetical protein
MRRTLLTQLSDAPEAFSLLQFTYLHADTVPRADLVAYVTWTQSGRKAAHGGVTMWFANTSNTNMANKQELIHFLEQHVFNPILKASADRYSEADQHRLRDVQDRTKSEKERFHRYSSAREVIDNYNSDLHSSTAKRVNRELEKLKLPTLPSVKDDFLKLAGEKHNHK